MGFSPSHLIHLPLVWVLLTFRPSGRLLASTQLKPNRNDVVFFERNGLRHGEFSFQTPPTNIRVRELLWSNDSAVLGVWCVQGEGEEEWVQLWTVGNYHWYLKQDIRLPRSKVKKSSSTSLVGLLWDPIIPLKLHLLTSGKGITFGKGILDVSIVSFDHFSCLVFCPAINFKPSPMES